MVEIDIPHGPCAIIQTTSMQDMAKKDLSILGCKGTIQFIRRCLLIENKRGSGNFSSFYQPMRAGDNNPAGLPSTQDFNQAIFQLS